MAASFLPLKSTSLSDRGIEILSNRRGRRKRNICRLFIPIAIVLSFMVDWRASLSSAGSTAVFVSSFTVRNTITLAPAKLSPAAFKTIETTEDQKHESILSRRQLTRSRRSRFPSRLFVGVSLSSAESKPPAPTDWVIVEEYPVISSEGIYPDQILQSFRSLSSHGANEDNDSVEKYTNAIHRLNITAQNLTLPVALMGLDPGRFPSLSNARKACRQGKIILSSSPASDSSKSSLHPPSYRKGLVGDRVYPFDRIARRELYKNIMPATVSSTSYNTLGDSFVKSKFQNLPVAYEDDYMAIIVKPAGLLVHPQGKNGNPGRKNNVLNALPYFVKKPQLSKIEDDEDYTILDKPVPVHRLDFATSGLLVTAKTRGASRLLAQEFEYRKAQKTYTAMVYGIPAVDKCTQSTKDTMDIPSFFGGDKTENNSNTIADTVDDTTEDDVEDRWENDDDDSNDDMDWDGWNLADCFLDNKRAKTYWRILGSHNCSTRIQFPSANDGEMPTIDTINIPISIVEMKPKTGRYHQLRRTMAWLYKTPIVGDRVYADNFVQDNFLPTGADLVEGKQLRDYSASLMLCSNMVDVFHPHYNTPGGRTEWEVMKQQSSTNTTIVTVTDHKQDSSLSSTSSLYESADGVRVAAAIQLPKKFTKFIDMMERKQKQVADEHMPYDSGMQ